MEGFSADNLMKVCDIFLSEYGLPKNTGGSHLSQVFCEYENLSSLSVIWLISTNLHVSWTCTILAKISAKWETGLTAVWLMWDPPVVSDVDTNYVSEKFENFCKIQCMPHTVIIKQPSMDRKKHASNS